MLIMAKPMICSDLWEIWQIIGWVLWIFKIVIPVIIIVFGMIDLGKAVVASKDDEIKKSVKSLIMRAIAGIIMFFVPTILDTKIYDDIVTINCEDAIKMVKVISKLEGIMVGISTAANICACIKYDSLIRKDNKNILTIAHDLLERYLSAY